MKIPNSFITPVISTLLPFIASTRITLNVSRNDLSAMKYLLNEPHIMKSLMPSNETFSPIKTDNRNFYSNLINHGCWCSMLNIDDPKSPKNTGGRAVDKLDLICKSWFKSRECIEKLSGGACHEDDEDETDVFGSHDGKIGDQSQNEGISLDDLIFIDHSSDDYYELEYIQNQNQTFELNCKISKKQTPCEIQSCQIDVIFIENLHKLLLNSKNWTSIFENQAEPTICHKTEGKNRPIRCEGSPPKLGIVYEREIEPEESEFNPFEVEDMIQMRRMAEFPRLDQADFGGG